MVQETRKVGPMSEQGAQLHDNFMMVNNKSPTFCILNQPKAIFNIRFSAHIHIAHKGLLYPIHPNSVWLQTGQLGFDPRQRQSIFPLASVSRPALNPPRLLSNEYRGLFLGVKCGRDVTLTTHPPSSAEVKNE
jgi:hypothetical protein